MKTYDITGIGNAIVDILSFVEPGIIDEAGVGRGSMNLVEADQSSAIYALLAETKQQSGGSAANTIAAAAALGRKVAYIGKVRGDAFGKIYRDDMTKTGAAFPTPDASDGAETGRSMILVTPDADRTMCTYLGIATDLGPEDVDAATVADSAILYLEGYLWDKPAAKEAFRTAMRVAHENGTQVALSLSDPFCVDRHRDSFVEIIQNDVDILFANEEELLSLYQIDEFDEAASRISQDVRIAAITRSEKGAVILSGEGRAEIAAETVAELVDTTGAGDLFAAGFMSGLASGQSHEVCGQMGCAAAGVVIQQLGPRCSEELKAKFAEKGWS